MQWTKQLKEWRRTEVRTRVGTILFCKNTKTAVKIKNSPRFTGFTAKTCKKYAVKIIFFSPHFTAFLTKIHRQTSTRVISYLKLSVFFSWGYISWTLFLFFSFFFSSHFVHFVNLQAYRLECFLFSYRELCIV